MNHSSIVKRALFLSSVAVASTAAASALASPGPADDRLLTAKTGWMAAGSKSVSDIDAIASAGTFRVTDLHVVSTSPLTFSVVGVKNSGAYAVNDWVFFHGETLDTVTTNLRAAGRRPIVLQPYLEGSDVHYAGVGVANTGANQRSWGVIEVANTENYGWYWYFGVKQQNVDGLAGQSLIDASGDGDANNEVNLVYYDGLPTPHGYEEDAPYFDTSLSDLFNMAQNLSYRPLFLTSWVLQGSGTAAGETEWLTALDDNG